MDGFLTADPAALLLRQSTVYPTYPTLVQAELFGRVTGDNASSVVENDKTISHVNGITTVYSDAGVKNIASNITVTKETVATFETPTASKGANFVYQ